MSTPSDEASSDDLNNFYARCPGGYYRAESADLDMTEGELLSDMGYVSVGYTARRLAMTAAQFFAEIDAAIEAVGLSVAEIERENVLVHQLRRDSGREVAANFARVRAGLEPVPMPVSQQADCATDALIAKLRPVFDELLRRGYSRKELTV